jgi:hypothetical protein
MDGIRGSRVLEIGLVGAIGLAAFIALSFVMPAFGHPIALALARWWRSAYISPLATRGAPGSSWRSSRWSPSSSFRS